MPNQHEKTTMLSDFHTTKKYVHYLGIMCRENFDPPNVVWIPFYGGRILPISILEAVKMIISVTSY